MFVSATALSSSVAQQRCLHRERNGAVITADDLLSVNAVRARSTLWNIEMIDNGGQYVTPVGVTGMNIVLGVVPTQTNANDARAFYIYIKFNKMHP